MPYLEKDSEAEYARMVFSLGQTLIERHEYALFKEFIISVRPFYDNIKNELFSDLIKECWKHYAYECLVCIFAFSGHNMFYKTSSLNQQMCTLE